MISFCILSGDVGYLSYDIVKNLVIFQENVK